MDIVAANAYEDTVSVLLGNGDGTFQAKSDYSVGSYPVSVAVADLNGDGKAEIVTANYQDDSVSVLTNQGNGAFQTNVDYPVGSYPSAVQVADITGSGKQDIVTANGYERRGDGSDERRSRKSRGRRQITIRRVHGRLASRLPIWMAAACRASLPSMAATTTVTALTVKPVSPTPTVTVGTIGLEGASLNAVPQEVMFTFRSADNSDPIVKTAYVGPDGSYALYDVPIAQYSVRIKAPKVPRDHRSHEPVPDKQCHDDAAPARRRRERR